MYSRALSKLIPSSQFTPNETACERGAYFDQFFQLTFEKMLQFQHGFSKKFRFSMDSAKYFAVSRDSAKVSTKKLFSRGSAKYFDVSKTSADLFLASQQLAIKALKRNNFTSTTGWAAILMKMTAVLGGLSSNCFQLISSFTVPSSRIWFSWPFVISTISQLQIYKSHYFYL